MGNVRQGACARCVAVVISPTLRMLTEGTVSQCAAAANTMEESAMIRMPGGFEDVGQCCDRSPRCGKHCNPAPFDVSQCIQKRFWAPGSSIKSHKLAHEICTSGNQSPRSNVFLKIRH